MKTTGRKRRLLQWKWKICRSRESALISFGPEFFFFFLTMLLPVTCKLDDNFSVNTFLPLVIFSIFARCNLIVIDGTR